MLQQTIADIDIYSVSCCCYCYCCRFSKFHASTKPHKWSQTVESMNISFGPDWQQYIHVDDTEQSPIGSGCVAQVGNCQL
jgi:predicted unusual protein kinase regulating ubiquinone biosynthesis (AarF/ABC1/UbiB family)